MGGSHRHADVLDVGERQHRVGPGGRFGRREGARDLGLGRAPALVERRFLDAGILQQRAAGGERIAAPAFGDLACGAIGAGIAAVWPSRR